MRRMAVVLGVLVMLAPLDGRTDEPAAEPHDCASAIETLKQRWETYPAGATRDAIALDILHAEKELKEKDETECAEFVSHAELLLRKKPIEKE